MEPRILAIIALCGDGESLGAALESAARQTLSPAEIIVIADPPALERARQQIHSDQVTLLAKADGGWAAACNHAVQHGSGDLIAVLSPEDTWHPQLLETLARPFAEASTPPLGWVYGDVDVIDDAGRISVRSLLGTQGGQHPRRDLAQCLGQGMGVILSAALIERSAFLAVGGFDEALADCAGDDLFLGMFQKGYGSVFIARALARRRADAANHPRAAGQAAYARKLLEAFPDAPERDLLISRFHRASVAALRSAILADDDEALAAARRDRESLLGTTQSPAVRLRPADLLISAVIPLYNGAPYIERALASVFDQTLRPVEVIVVDDGSTDNGVSIVERIGATHPIRLFSKQNGGQSSARNLGVARARGDFIALLDQDDVWYPAHLEKLAQPFTEPQPRELGWSYSNLDEIDETGRVIAHSFLTLLKALHPKTNLVECLKEDMFVLPSASLVLRSAFEAIGGFDEQLSGYEDDDLFLRLFQAGYGNAFVNEALSQWRIYETSSSYTPRMGRSRVRYARKLLEKFPDDPGRNRYYTRDLLIPRFYRKILGECRKAIAKNDTAGVNAAWQDVEALIDTRPVPRLPDAEPNDLLISAVIPLYNGAPYIEATLRSVFGQTLPPLEVIVVDDGSTDDGPAIVERLAVTYPIKLFRKHNGGQSSARNFGVARSGGDYIALLDQDDIWYPTHLERLAEPFVEMQTYPLGWSYSDLDEIDETGQIVTREFLATLKIQHPKRDLFSCLRADMFVLPSASLIARAAFETVGGFDEQLSGYEDDDLFLRLFQAGYGNVFVPEALSQWRIYMQSSSYTPRMARSRVKYAHKLLESFPDDPDRNRYYHRDLIVPRFFHQMVGEYMKALRSGDMDQVHAAGEDFDALAPYPRVVQTFATAMLTSPLVANPVGAKVVTTLAPVIRPLARWVLRPRRGDSADSH